MLLNMEVLGQSGDPFIKKMPYHGQFINCVKFLKDIKFSKMHVFKYSIRKGTPAATFTNQVSDDKKEERSNILLEMSDIHEKEFAENYIGKEVEVLFENEIEGHTTNYIRVVREDKGEQSEIKVVMPTKFEKGALYV